MINQFISIQSSSAINTNICEDVSVDTDAEASSRMCATNDGAGTGNAECTKTGLTHAITKLSEVSNNEFCEGQSKDGTVNAAMGSMAATKTETKINFSVDRLLSKISVDNEKKLNSNKSNLGRNGQKSVLTIDQLLATSTRSDQQQTNKQIVRPMPMRYLQSTTTPAAVKPAATMYSVNGPQSIHMQQYFKYINSNASNFNQLPYPKQSQQSQQMSSVVDASTVCSTGRYLDTFVTHKSSFVSADSNLNSASSIVSTISPTGHVKRKRSWSRAVFSQLQRKGLEIQFQIQKYITKPDRRKLAARLGLTDAQVKVWFQNRRMKWRHTRETKLNAEEKINRQTNGTGDDATNATSEDDDVDDLCSAGGSSDDDEIDVVAE